MSLNRREMIAAMALQGLLSQYDEDMATGVYDGNPNLAATEAVEYADSLIAALDVPRTPPLQRKELAGDPAAPGSIDVGSSASGSKDGTPLPSDSSLSPGPGKLSECGSCGGRGQRQVPPDWTWRVCDRCCGSGKAAA